MPQRTLGPGQLFLGIPATPTGNMFSAPSWEGDTIKTSVEPSIDTGDTLAFLSGDTELGDDTITWVLKATIADDYLIRTSVTTEPVPLPDGTLTTYLAINAGKEAGFIWIPNRTSADPLLTLAIGGKLRLRPMAIGGDVKSKNTNDVELPIIGDPVFSNVEEIFDLVTLPQP